jgi:SWI/SNF-related matrix-associated actin-dependent regulator of chromatin subfamily A member 5
MLRRLKADVEKSLPPKHETILFTGLSAMQKKLYRDILMRDFEAIQGTSGSRTAILNIVMQLRKCAGHPYLFPGVEDRTLPPLGEHLVENCGKMVLLDKLLRRLKERGHRVLVFTQFARILDILEDYMVMRRFLYCRIDGNTSYDDRERMIDEYNAPDSEKFVFLLSTRAGGLGINLQTADVVIIYDSDWNPQMDLQAQEYVFVSVCEKGLTQLMQMTFQCQLVFFSSGLEVERTA